MSPESPVLYKSIKVVVIWNSSNNNTIGGKKAFLALYDLQDLQLRFKLRKLRAPSTQYIALIPANLNQITPIPFIFTSGKNNSFKLSL